MSDDWLTGNITGNDRILKAVGGNEKEARAILKAMKNNQVEKVLTKVDEKGITTTFRVDAEGKIIGRWP